MTDKKLEMEYFDTLPDDIKELIREYGMKDIHELYLENFSAEEIAKIMEGENEVPKS